jgi:hypothetical protein
MQFLSSKKLIGTIILALLTVSLIAPTLLITTVQAQTSQVLHDTKTEFAPGTFYQTVLEGTETAPEIELGTETTFSWSFADDDITGWTYLKTGAAAVAEESPAGQIHLKALYDVAESYGLAYHDVTFPNEFVVEYRLYFDSIQASGVADPFVSQPTGACARLDVWNPSVGFRMDVFTDRMVSFYRVGTTGVNYPTIAYFDIATNLAQWYTLRFEINFSDPDLKVQVYRDSLWVGELKADTRNAASATRVRPLAYSRGSLSGVSEFHIDYVKVGSKTTTLYGSGTYSSAVLDLGATSFGKLSWTEIIPTSPYPWGEWTKYAGNPVLPTTQTLVENMLVDVNDPEQKPLLYDGKYWLCYADTSTLRLAYSTDPNLLTWTPYSSPVLSPGAGEYYLYSPNIFKNGDTYYLVYDVAKDSPHGSAQRIAYATAPTPVGPYTKGPVILDIGAAGEFDDGRVSEPFVFKDGATYYLFYMGEPLPLPFGDMEQIALASTSAADFPLGPGGGNWTKHGLILPHNPDPTAWDRGYTGNPSLIKVGGTFYMLYTGSYANEHWKLGIAYALSPLGPWTRPPGPNVPLGPPGSWDSDRLVRGAIHYYNGRYVMPYTGALSGYQGGIATANPFVVEELVGLETRTSPDGSAWEEWKPVLNDSAIQSSPNRYFQYRATLHKSSSGTSPTLTSVTINYEKRKFNHLFIDPSLVQKDSSHICTTFQMTIMIENIADLWGFDFKLTWDNSMITLVGVEFNTTLDNMWGSGNWFMDESMNVTGPGYYELAAVSTSTSFTHADPTPLAAMTFHVENAPPGETPIHFALVKLSNSSGEAISATTTDAIYRMISLPWYIKPPYPDYAPSGMPDFDERQWGTYNWKDNTGAWSHCGPVALANSLWWFDSKYESLNDTNPPIPPLTISDSFSLVKAYGAWDDHDPQNVPPLVEHLAWLMDCDAQRTGPFTGVFWSGTFVNDMEAGLAQYLSWSGVNPLGDVNGDGVVDQTDANLVNAAFGSAPGGANWNLAADIYPATTGYPPTTDNIIDANDLNLVQANLGKTGIFYEHTVSAECRTDFFQFIEGEVEKSQDVVLLLGIYCNGVRQYGHFVTVAGVNSTTGELLISNPIRNEFEAGNTPGRSPVPHNHLAPEPPYTTHNNASLVSHDTYLVAPSAHPQYHMQLEEYVNETGWVTLIESAVITSPKPVKPDIEILPPHITCRKFCEHFEVKINLTHVVGVHDFHFEIMYNTMLLDYVDILWGELGPGTVTVNEVAGLVEGQIVPTNPNAVVNGNPWLLNITFHASYHHIWKAGQTNDVHDRIWFHWAQLTYLTGPPQTYEEAGTKEIDVYDAQYTFSPVQGDVDNDGYVGIEDLRTVAIYYDAKQGDPDWGDASVYDLTSYGVIDIFDLVVVASNFGYKY